MSSGPRKGLTEEELVVLKDLMKEDLKVMKERSRAYQKITLDGLFHQSKEIHGRTAVERLIIGIQRKRKMRGEKG